MQRVTIRDVAAAAGVSVATVSRVISGTRPVRQELASAVEEACRRLGYRGDQVARSLRRRSTQAIGMIVPHIANPFFAGLVQAVERELRSADQSLLLGDSRDDPELEAFHVRALLDRRVDGVLMIPCEAEASSRTVREALREIPVVQLDRWVSDVDADHVAVDNAAGIAAALGHLEALGRRRTAFIGAQPSISTARERLNAYSGTARAQKGRTHKEVLLGDFSLEWGNKAAHELASRGDFPDGIVCGNDLIALGVLQGLRELGVDVPSRVAVVGFDDIGFAQISHPPLTTVRQPLDAIGAEAARLLLGRVGGYHGPPRRTRLAPELVVRGSTSV
ncbi:MAG: LacI family DNA-binding transcriptional regulator [Actinomycetota bacterium]